MTQLEIGTGDLVDTPLGKKSMPLIVAALEAYRDPTSWISVHWSVSDVRSRKEGLSDEMARHVLEEVKKNHDAELGISWDLIDYWISELYGDVI